MPNIETDDIMTNETPVIKQQLETTNQQKLYLPWQTSKKMEFARFCEEEIDTLPPHNIKEINGLKLRGYVKEDVIAYFKELARLYTKYIEQTKKTDIKFDTLPRIKNTLIGGLDIAAVNALRDKVLFNVHREFEKTRDAKNFVALGVSKSGKTSFMASMYYRMATPVGGFQLTMEDEEEYQKLKEIYRAMADTEADVIARFPASTNQTKSYLFNLEYQHDLVDRFQWIDYKGGILRDGEISEIDALKQDISHAEVLYIFVDGDLFHDVPGTNEKELEKEILYRAKNECADDLNHLLSDYTATNNHLPPIVFMITKFDKIFNELSEERDWDKDKMLDLFTDIIRELFSGVLPRPEENTDTDTVGYNSMVGIMPVSVGMQIAQNDYHGKFEPFLVHIGILIGVWFLLNKEVDSAEKSMDSAAGSTVDTTGFYEQNAAKKRDAAQIIVKAIEAEKVKFFIDGTEKKFSECAQLYLKKKKAGMG